MGHAMRCFTAFRFSLNRLLLLGLCCSCWTAAAAQDAARQLMERLHARYQQIDALQASFVQILQTPYAERPDTLRGRLWLQGDRYRVETPRQTIVTDGRTTWVYLPDTRQVLINDYVPDETGFSLSEFLLHYSDRYEVRGGEAVTYQNTAYHRLHLRPLRPEAPFQEVVLWVRDRDLLVTRVDVRDVNDTRMTFLLSDLVLNPALSPELFTFRPPDGVEVVDLRQ